MPEPPVQNDVSSGQTAGGSDQNFSSRWLPAREPAALATDPVVVDLTDAELIGRYRQGEAHALELLLDRYETPLFHFLLGVLKDHHQAEDTLQETWCRALQNLDIIDGNHLRGWLFTVAYHQAMLCKRKQRNANGTSASLLPRQAAETCPVEQAQLREAADRLATLLERLSPKQREVIRQRIFEGKRFQDIARDLDCPVNTALARMHEGLKRLRRLWGPEYV